MNRYFITGGGTGGHIYPAIAVADELLADEDTEKIFYIGNPNNLEASIVKGKNYTFLPVISSGMPREISLGVVLWAFKMLFATVKCLFYILKFKPDAIFGTGGYVSAPIMMAAAFLKVPFVMHDCDANPGLVTRKLSGYASSISVAFDVAKEKLNNHNIYVNGNPIREEFKSISQEGARRALNLESRLTLCIMGGSQGARTINTSAVGILKTLTTKFGIQVIFQTGKKNYEQVISNLKDIYPEYENDKFLIVRPYFDNMPVVLKACDIAVSRAGSLSISEICASSVAPIFIPYPHAASDHQRKNARYMESKGAGIYLEDHDTTPEKLLAILKELIQDSEKLNYLKKNTFALANLNSTKAIAKQVKDSINH